MNGAAVTLTWTAASGAPSSYVLEAGTSIGAMDSGTFDTGTSATMLALSGVPNGIYYVRVKARNACGTSAASNEMTVAVGVSTLSGTITATPLGEILVDARVEALRAGRVEVSATSDSRGFYRLTRLMARDFVIRTTKTGYNVGDAAVTVSGDVRHDIVMDRNRVSLRGWVSEAQPCFENIDVARIEVVRGPDSGKAATSDRSSGYQLDGIAWGVVAVRASKSGYASVEVSGAIPPPFAAQGTIGRQDFRLQSQVGRYALFGEVRDAASGSRISGALVEITAGFNAGRSTMSGTAGPGDGVYRFGDLIPGTLALRVSKAGFTTETHANLVVCSDGRNDVMLTPVGSSSK